MSIQVYSTVNTSKEVGVYERLTSQQTSKEVGGGVGSVTNLEGRNSSVSWNFVEISW